MGNEREKDGREIYKDGKNSDQCQSNFALNCSGIGAFLTYSGSRFQGPQMCPRK